MRTSSLCVAVACAILSCVQQLQAADAPIVGFEVQFDATLNPTPFTGRVHVMLLKQKTDVPPKGYNWFSPEPGYAKNVVNSKPGETITLGPDCVGTMPFDKIPPGRYYAMAILDRDQGGLSFSASEGNLYSEAVKLELGKEPLTEPIKLLANKVFSRPKFIETENVKLIELKSEKLSRFHGRDIVHHAAVILPPSAKDHPEKKYPVVYEIPGFSGDHYAATGIALRRPWQVGPTEMIWVVLDPSCRIGHTVFANSANNGPCGDALVEEFIPAIEQKFPIVGSAKQRFLTGHSSGGWASLWLQVSYPDFFGGCWSTSPDPVDFRDFQRTNLYEPNANLFYEADGKPRPLARVSGKVLVNFPGFSQMEDVMGRGGQLASFESSFSPKGTDGKPMQLWDRKTGAINPQTAKSWEPYDIRLKLEREWPKLAKRLGGKIHVYMGDADTFYLEGATQLLASSVKKIQADVTVELFPGKTHSLIDAALRKRINQEIADASARETVSNEK